MLDWRALGDETVGLLQRYLTIDTTNPPGNEIAGARFLAEVLAADGIPSETVESAPGRANLVARLSGDGSLGGIVLHDHMDVVYADRRSGGRRAASRDTVISPGPTPRPTGSSAGSVACWPPSGRRACCPRSRSSIAGSPTCCRPEKAGATTSWRRRSRIPRSARASSP